MQHFPIFMNMARAQVVVSGGGDACLAKLRLLMKTEATLHVFTPNPAPDLAHWAAEGRVSLTRRPLRAGDVRGAALFYAADEDATKDARTAAIAHSEGALVNIVNNLADSAFITPAIVNRDPVTVAIGTEGAAPVLARAIKADLEARLPATLGPLARLGKAFRRLAEALPHGRKRRDFWSAYYFDAGPRAFAEGEDATRDALDELLAHHLAEEDRPGHVSFIGAGPGDPELLTLKARRLLDAADVVIHDRLVTPEILELARREALIVDAGKMGFGPSMSQEQINTLLVEHGLQGAQVVRLKGGDPTVFGRLDEEMEALEEAGIGFDIVPGITAASAALAGIGQSFTRRGRNRAARFLTGHDMQGFAEQDWKQLSAPGEVAAIYMGKKAARFIQGRLMMHGAPPDTPVSIVENVSRPDQQVLESTLGRLCADLNSADLSGPALMLYGLAPRAAAQFTSLQQEVS